MCAESLSYVWLFVTPWTLAGQAPLSVGFPGKKTGVGFHFTLQEIFQNESEFPMSTKSAGRLSTTEPSGKPQCAAANEAHGLREQEKPLQWEARARQRSVAPTHQS